MNPLTSESVCVPCHWISFPPRLPSLSSVGEGCAKPAETRCLSVCGGSSSLRKRGEVGEIFVRVGLGREDGVCNGDVK